ncbi:MAG: N-acetylglucosamine-6-phosphate deacetylase [Firmicutes bacterium]|nr:N-acetylglucosamine-6-phosphate deacetylase [Bacillota bacterium]
MYTLLSDKSISNGKTHGLRAYSTEKGKISGIESAPSANSHFNGEVIDLRGLTVMPGLIDIHTHGLMGLDVMSATPGQINEMSVYKLKEGVTSFFPSTVTSPMENIYDAVENIRLAISTGIDGANIAGILLEGPYINPEYKGAHVPEYIKPINLDDIKNLALTAQKAVPSGITSIIIAPDIPNAIEAIQSLSALGINCCLGHTAASYEQGVAGIKAGGKIAIHIYNAMSQLQHRAPGMVGAILTSDDIYAELICDLIHVHPAAIKAAFWAKGPDKTILVTDSAAPAGLPDGEYNLGRYTITKKDGVARTPGGAIASSSIGLISCVKNMYEVVGTTLTDAVTMATATPAKAVGMYEYAGSLCEGKNADIIAIDDDFNVRFVMVGGVIKQSCQ